MRNPSLQIDGVIAGDSIVRMKRMGNIIELLYSDYISEGGNIKKIDSESYLVLSTGEVKSFKHEENRADDLDSIRNSMTRLRDIINTNVIKPHFCRWLTLTYKENMQNPQKLLNDFKNFNTRCRGEYGHYEYIAVAEPQGRGAWHLHVVLIFPSKAPFMPNDRVQHLWGHGFVNIRKLQNIDNVGAYLIAYLGDVELDEYKKLNPDCEYLGELKEVEIVDKNGHKASKRFVKGARLAMYPPGFHLYRCSKGIKRPEKEYLSYNRAKKVIGKAALTYRREIEIGSEEEAYHNTLIREIYNQKRQKTE